MNPHQGRSVAPQALFTSLWQHRALIGALAKREILVRYKGSIFGVAWSFLTPLLTLLVFTFVFGEIFQARWGGARESGTLDFATALFAGLMVYTFFAEALSRAPSLIVGNPNFVKKVVFPVEILPLTSTLGAAFQLGMAYLLLLLMLQFSQWPVGASVALVPLILLPLIVLTQGLCWLLSALGVFVRDIGQLVQPALTALLFLSPIFYPLSSVPPALQGLFRLNPITYTVEAIRNALLHGTAPDWTTFAAFSALCAAVAWLGFAVFQWTRNGFADVI
ncbi:MAG: ABC transporter permease [Hydrogenophaga sp.]|jgi:lipopolysaccharide transport system permease protein|nr:ABC transporter permease [Hydrogenophaga sp.]